MGELAAFGGWPGVLGRLLDGEDLGADVGTVLDVILDGQASSAQIAALLVLLRRKGESAAEIASLVDVMVAHALTVPVDREGLVDTCGTGGDRLGTVNVSTMAALVVAGAGVKVAKHGNRAASSTCGSADVLEELGVKVDAAPDVVAACIDEANIGFCFAPVFHPAMRHVGPVRRELGVPTVFNFLGPLANPAGARRQVVGVSDASMAERMVEVLELRGAEHAMVVHGAEGLDELSTTGRTTVWETKAGVRSCWTMHPTDFGIPVATIADLRGGDAVTNAQVARDTLAGAPGPVRDVVLLNAAAALVVGGTAAGIDDGISLAATSIDGGAAATALARFIEASNRS